MQSLGVSFLTFRVTLPEGWRSSPHCLKVGEHFRLLFVYDNGDRAQVGVDFHYDWGDPEILLASLREDHPTPVVVDGEALSDSMKAVVRNYAQVSLREGRRGFEVWINNA